MFLVCRMIIATSDAPCAAGGERRPCGDDVEVLPVISITTIRGALASCSHQDMNEGLKHAYRRMLDELPAEFLRDCVKIEEEDGRVGVIIEATYIVQQLVLVFCDFDTSAWMLRGVLDSNTSGERRADSYMLAAK